MELFELKSRHSRLIVDQDGARQQLAGDAGQHLLGNAWLQWPRSDPRVDVPL